MVDHPPTLARPASLTGALGYSVTNCTSDTNDAPSYGVYAHPGLTLVRRTQIYVAPSTNDPSGFPKPLHPSLRPSPQEQSGRAPARWYPALTCLYPVKCWPAIPPARGIVFNPSKTWRDKIDKPMFIACRQCQGCRVDHSKEWGLRCHHESKLHKQNCCLTLTYDNDHFPKTGSISRSHIQLFLKRLRKHIAPVKIRFFATGEYGPTNKRPHYHILIFGYDFPDKKFLYNKNDRPYYKSETLNKLWGLSTINTIGDMSMAAARYCAQYALKKINGKQADEYYYRAHPLTGEYFHVLPEFIQMSTRPGIGAAWAEKYMPNLLSSDFVIYDGQNSRACLLS